MKKGSTKVSPLAALSASPGIKGGITLGSAPQLPVPPADEIREELQRLILKDLLGPADTEQEELAPRESRVRERYLLGALAPRGIAATAIDAATPLATSGSDSVEDGNVEGESSTTETMLPSSLGLSFMVLPGIDMLSVECAWGHYTRADSANAKTETGQARKVWKRTPRHGTVPLLLKEGDLGFYSPVSEQSDIVLRGKARQTPKGWLVTLFLVNQQEKPASREDEAWIFQPVVTVSGPGESAIFTKRTWLDLQSATLDALSRAEMQSLDMLYRHQLEFAAGHGVSVKATLHDMDTSLAVRLETTFVPSYDVPKVDAPLSDENPDLAGIQLDMRVLAEHGPQEVLDRLQVLHRAYEKWIGHRRDDLANGTDGLGAHTAAAKQALMACERAAQRIKEGIHVLSADPVAFEAFQFANRAMWQQRVRSIFAKEVRKAAGKGTVALEAIDTAKNRSWRPFQLAFVLLNLPSLTNPLHPERSEGDGALCDLLWFPTGGGKTEAYLGLTAYTLALRRLQSSDGELESEHGVAVLMRYTLRLLTLQQFQRASGLLCACESIRRGDPVKWGHTPMRIGLWVGRKTTPNTTEQAAEALIQIRNSQGTGVGTPAQLTSCPWCGCAINRTRHIKAFTGNSTIRRTIIYCGDELGECLFSEKHSPMEGLPVMVVDEEMYRNPPAVLVATVDKFAQMCWKGEVQTLFGRVSGWCERHGFRSPELEDTDSHPAAGDLPSARTVPHACLRPPDLVIQDELHLISGPLGSMVGLYESAIDSLCTWTKNGQRVRPKVIASTATIRRAEQQVKQLFMRRVEVFPPAGLSLDDNFFSKRRKPGPQHPGRRYVGICAFGKRYPAAIIRLYVAILASAQALYEKYDGAVDPWMTLVGYFNSIRELAGTRRLVEDDIRSRLQRADIRGLARRLLRSNPEELTSRRSGEEIPRILDRLDLPFSKAGEQHRKDEREKTGKPIAGPYDVVLATNMISVGVDVDRLGLMVVAGQPKTTAEYIQATSRVGRQKPGLVFCLYNWARPRDLSHFETFEHYHATFYQHVEALSVTPFAARALDRGLSGVMAAMIRLPKFLLNPNESAGDLRDDEPLLNACIDALSSRGAAITDKAAVKEDVRKMLAKRRDEWLTRGRRAKDHKLGYSNDGDVVGLLQQARGQDWQLFTCLNSLRDVEPTVNLLLADDRGLNPFDLKEPGPPEASAPAANPEELP